MSENEKQRVKIYLDEDTGLHYIKGLTVVLFDNGVQVDRAAFDSRIANHRSIADLIRESRQHPENCGWDFAMACSTANLVRKKAHVAVDVAPPKLQEPEHAMLQEQKEKAEEKPTDRIGAIKAFFSAPHADIIAIATVIGLFSAMMSMYHAFVFLHEVNGKPSPVAAITAFTMVLFAASAFTIARHLFDDKKISLAPRLFLSPVFVLLGVAVIWFLVFSTITVNYEQFKARDQAKEEQFVAKDSSVSAKAATQGIKDTEIANATADIERLTNDSNRWYAEYSKSLPQELLSADEAEQKKIDAARSAALKARDSAFKQYTTAQTNLAAAVAKRDALMAAKAGTAESTEGAISAAKAKRETAYTVVARKTGISESTLQFLVYVIPPAFFDVVSPVTLSVVLLLRDRRKDKDEKKAESLFDKIKRLFKKEA